MWGSNGNNFAAQINRLFIIAILNKMSYDISQSEEENSNSYSSPQIPSSQCSPDKNQQECNFDHVVRGESESSVSQRNLSTIPYPGGIEESDNISEADPTQTNPIRQDRMNFCDIPNYTHDISIYLNQINPILKNPEKSDEPPMGMAPQVEQFPERQNRLFWQQKNQTKKTEASKEKGKGTKNIIKNFGRNTITFVEASKYLFCEEFKKMGKNYLEYLPKLTRIRERINTISDMRNLWVDQEHGKLMRRISEHYFRKQALSYVFNSHVKPDVYADHIECRRKLREALRDPNNFTNLK